MILGWIFAIITGIGLPSFAFLFGDIINSYGPEEDVLDQMETIALVMVLIGAAVWILAYLMYALLLTSSERIMRRTKLKYIEAILN